MDIMQMVLTLIRATKKTTSNCMSALSVCIVPNVNCKQSQQLRTICTCVTDYTHKYIWYTSQMQRTSRTKWIYSDMTIGSLLEKCFWHNYQENNKEVLLASATRTTLRTTDGMVYYSSHQSSIYWNNSSMHWNEIRVLKAVSGFTNPFGSSFEDNELCFLSFDVPAKPGIANILLRLMTLAGRLLQTALNHF